MIPRELPVHGVHLDHPTWYWWAIHGKITQVHKMMENYMKVMEGFMGDE